MLDRSKQEYLMRIAMEEAESAILRGDQPIGGLIADGQGNIVVRNGNRQNTEMNPSSHAEMVLIREATKKLGTADLSGYVSVCTAEACPMCSSALIIAGIREFYFGAKLENTFRPYIHLSEVAERSYSDNTIVGGILENECTALLLREGVWATGSSKS